MTVTEGGLVPRRKRRRATLRLAIQLFLLAAIVTAAAAWLALAQVARTFELQIREQLAGRERETMAAVDGLQLEVRQSLQRIDAYLRTDLPLLERLFLETPDLRDVAEPLMHLHGLDLLDILSAEGVVLSSGHRPARVNLDAHELLRLPADRTVLHSADAEGGPAAVFVERHVLEYGSRRLMLVGGRWLGRPLVDRAAEGGAVLLFVADPGAPPIVSDAVTPELVASARRWITESAVAADRPVVQGAGPEDRLGGGATAGATPAALPDPGAEGTRSEELEPGAAVPGGVPPGTAPATEPGADHGELPGGLPEPAESASGSDADPAGEEVGAGPTAESSASGGGSIPQTGAPMLRTGAPGGADESVETLTGSDGSRWRARRFALVDWERRPLGSIVVAVARAPFDALLIRMRNWFLVLGSTVGLLAALVGVLIARGTTRPVDDLIQAFDAIAAGEADYTFEVRAGDELQELRAAFSRTHRALERHRRRSLAAERVAAWREVARHVAHEVKNPLAPIRTTVENLMRARRQAPERFDRMFGEGMETILEEVRQLSRIVGEFAEFARLPLPSPSHVALDGLIDRAVELYASEPGIEIESYVDPRMPQVELDADQISRALKNVIRNAIEAVRDQPEERTRDPRVEIRATCEDDQAQIEICDNGPGFSEESSRRLFEPYFTTKESGTGLGMALAYRIVVEHGGVIFAENRASGGARVVIRLPLVAASPGEVAGQRESYG